MFAYVHVGNKTVTNPSKIIKNLIIDNKNNTNSKSKAGIYDIQCRYCNRKIYVGETICNLKKKKKKQLKNIKRI